MPTSTPWTPITFDSAKPAYQQVADQIRVAVASGHLPTGARVPSELELMTECRTSRVTVRNAIQALRQEGLVLTHHGRGSFIRDTAVSKILVRRLDPDGCGATGRRGPCTATDHVHEQVWARMPTAEERTRFDIAAGVPLLVVTQQRHRDDRGRPDVLLPADRITLQYRIDSPS